jgi:hypothetical protein
MLELLRSYKNKQKEHNMRRTLKHERCSSRNGAQRVFVKLERGYSS